MMHNTRFIHTPIVIDALYNLTLFTINRYFPAYQPIPKGIDTGATIARMVINQTAL